MPSPFSDIRKRVERFAQGSHYGSKVCLDDGQYFICDGVRPYSWQPINLCDECREPISEGDMAHWDEINNRIVCMHCYAA